MLDFAQSAGDFALWSKRHGQVAFGRKHEKLYALLRQRLRQCAVCREIYNLLVHGAGMQTHFVKTGAKKGQF